MGPLHQSPPDAIAPRSEASVLIARALAHEVTNTLAGIMGLAQLMMRGSDPGSRMHGKADQIRGAALRASVLPGQVSAVVAGSGACEAVDLSQFVVDSLPLIRQVVGTPIAVADVAHAERCWAWAPRDRVASTLVLLALSARRALPEGGQMQVMARALQDRRALLLIVDGKRVLKPIETPTAPSSGIDLLSDALRAVSSEVGGDLTQEERSRTEIAVQLAFRPAANPPK